ncbi:MAG: hypothetical protein HKN58_09630 [Xanthomonadales bacterium]|nr:hypothetical protein [Xanthomonadales bacterium]
MKKGESSRAALLRESIVFQLKLLVDGTRDFVLVPVAMFATLVGLLRGGDQPAREFHRVLELGRQSEQWINLFGQHEPIEKAGQAGSLDLLLTRAEQVVREQARAGGVSDSASQEIEKALEQAHRTVRGEPDDSGSKEGTQAR